MDSDFKSQNYRFIKTGIEAIDITLGGFLNSEFIIVGGRPGIGKTKFLIHLALHLAKENCVFFHSIESNNQLSKARFLSCVSGIDLTKIIAEKNAELFNHYNDDFEKIYISDQNSFENIEELEAFYVENILKHDLKVIIVDVLQLISIQLNYKNKEQEITEVCKILHKIAIKYHILVISSSQVSRSVENRGGLRIPILSDLRGCGSIEELADKVLFLYRSEVYGLTADENGMPTKGVMDIHVAKNKYGICDVFSVLYNENFTQFITKDRDLHFQFT